MGTLGGMVASALAAASFGRRRKREICWDEGKDKGEIDLMVKVDKGVEEVVSKLEGRQESGMLMGLLNGIWKFFI